MSSSGTQNMLENLLRTLIGLPDFMWIASSVIGLGLMLAGLLKATHLGDRGGVNQTQSEMGAAITLILCGVLLFSLKSFIQISTMSVFSVDGSFLGSTSGDILTYAKSKVNSSSPGAGYIVFAVGVIFFVGVYGVAAGLVMMYRSFGDARVFWNATWHILGGVFCVNIVTMIRIMGASMGGTVGSFVTSVLSSP